MKHLKSLLAAAAFIFGASQTISAQAKIAHVDTNEIMSKMPAMLEPMQPRVGEKIQRALRLTGQSYTVAASPADDERVFDRTLRRGFLRFAVS